MKQLLAGTRAEENQALLEALLSGQVSSIFEKLQVDQQPTLRPAGMHMRLLVRLTGELVG